MGELEAIRELLKQAELAHIAEGPSDNPRWDVKGFPSGTPLEETYRSLAAKRELNSRAYEIATELLTEVERLRGVVEAAKRMDAKFAPEFTDEEEAKEEFQAALAALEGKDG